MSTTACPDGGATPTASATDESTTPQPTGGSSTAASATLTGKPADTSGGPSTSTTATTSTSTTTTASTDDATGTTHPGTTATTDSGTTDTTDSGTTDTTDSGTTDTTAGSTGTTGSTGGTAGTSSGGGPFCGDGVVDPGEACDDGPDNANNAACTLQCAVAECGDGLIHNAGGGIEQCDGGMGNGPGQACNAACELNVCGDADPGPNEECDDGNLENGDGCSQICTLEGCGNAVVEPGEACDDGKNGDQDDGCTDKCQPPACGDGYVQASELEECDDGNQSDADACLHTCKKAACGDGLVNVGVEECDDGNANSGDLCATNCTSTSIKKVVTAHSHTCLLFESGRLRCWGESLFGELGYGNTDTLGDEPGEMPTTDVPIGGKAIDVDLGQNFTCVLLDTNKLRCFGYNGSGQLGVGTKINAGDNPGELPTPNLQFGANVTSFSTGTHHTCAIVEGGNVRCWGEGNSGALGYENENNIGDGPGEMPPANVKLLGAVTRLNLGSSYSCALRQDGQLLCWGWSVSGQLGIGPSGDVGDNTNEMPPDAAQLGPGAVAEFAAGYGHVCARFVGGVVRCWGNSEYGQLGYGNTNNIGDGPGEMSPPAVDIGGTPIQLAAGEHHTCALLDTGKVRCWGRGQLGSLGYGNTNNIGDGPGEMPPPDVDLGGTAVQISARNGWTTCAVLTDGSLRCWGYRGAYAYGSAADIGDDETPASAGPVPF